MSGRTEVISRMCTLLILAGMPYGAFAQGVTDDLRHPLVQVRVDTLVAVQERGTASEDELAAIEDLAVNDPSERVRQQAALALAVLKPEEGRDRALADLASPSEELRSVALEALARSGPTVLGPVLERLNYFATSDCAEDSQCQPDVLATLRLVAGLVEATDITSQEQRLPDRSLLHGLEQWALANQLHSRDPSQQLQEIRRVYVALAQVDPHMALPSLLDIVRSCEVGRCVQFYFPAFSAISWPSADYAENVYGLQEEAFERLKVRLADQLTDILADHVGGGQGYINDSGAFVNWAEVISRVAGGRPSRSAIVTFSRIFSERLSSYERGQTRPPLAQLLPSSDTEWILDQVGTQLSRQSSQLALVDLVGYLESIVVTTGDQDAVYGLVNLLEVAGDAPLAGLRRLAANPDLREVLAPAASVFTSLLADQYLDRSEPFSPGEFLGLLRLVALLPDPSSCDVVREVDAVGYEQRVVFASDAQEIRVAIGTTLDAVCYGTINDIWAFQVPGRIVDISPTAGGQLVVAGDIRGNLALDGSTGPWLGGVYLANVEPESGNLELLARFGSGSSTTTAVASSRELGTAVVVTYRDGRESSLQLLDNSGQLSTLLPETRSQYLDVAVMSHAQFGDSFVVVGADDGYPYILVVAGEGRILLEETFTDNRGSFHGVAVDPTGNLILVGTEIRDADVVRIDADRDAVVRKYGLVDLNRLPGLRGEVIWRYVAGTSWDNVFNDVYVSPEGIITSVGATNGSLFAETRGDSDSIAVQLAPDGTVLWERQFGSNGPDGFTSVTGTGATVIAAGKESVDRNQFGNFVSDAVAITLDPEGSEIGRLAFGLPNVDDGISAIVTSGGSVIVAGRTGGSLFSERFGGENAFAARFD